MTTLDNSESVMWEALCFCSAPTENSGEMGVKLYSCVQCWVAALPSAETLSPKIYWMIALQLPLFNNCIYCFHSFE